MLAARDLAKSVRTVIRSVLWILVLLIPGTALNAAQLAAIDSLRANLTVEARYAGDPWALSHAILAFGPDFELATGGTILKRLESLARSEEGGGAHYDLLGTGAMMGEMHPHYVFKTLTGEGLDPDLCGRLARSAVAKTERPATTEEWNDVAWLLEGLARTPGYSANSTIGAGDLKLRALAEGALVQVEAADTVVAALLSGKDGFRRPQGGGDPTQAGIWAYTCGGQHLLQGVIVAYQKGLLPKEDRKRLESELKLFERRVTGEAGFRDVEKQEAIAAGANRLLAEHNAMVLVLKLHGHALETLSRARDAGLGDPAELRAAAIAIRDDLEARLLAFHGVLDLGKLLPSVRSGDPATWRKWFGDGCHALHGLALWPELAAGAEK